MKRQLVVRTVEKIVGWVYCRAWSGRMLSDQPNNLQFETLRNNMGKKITSPSVQTG
jgi:hypothetical protein